MKIKDFLKIIKKFLVGRPIIKITLPWFGEKQLSKPKPRDKPIIKEEIWRDLRKRGSNGN